MSLALAARFQEIVVKYQCGIFYPPIQVFSETEFGGGEVPAAPAQTIRRRRSELGTGAAAVSVQKLSAGVDSRYIHSWVFLNRGLETVYSDYGTLV